MKIYYAHSRMKYNTMIEQYELALIRQKFPNAEIINPNGTVDQNQSEEAAMKECYKLIDGCDILVFSSVDGVIGKGVYQEISKCSRVYYIQDNSIVKHKSYGFTVAGEVKGLKELGIAPDMIYAIVL